LLREQFECGEHNITDNGNPTQPQLRAIIEHYIRTPRHEFGFAAAVAYSPQWEHPLAILCRRGSSGRPVDLEIFRPRDFAGGLRNALARHQRLNEALAAQWPWQRFPLMAGLAAEAYSSLGQVLPDPSA